MVKICPRCKKREEFSKCKGTYDRLQSACKECKKKDQINFKIKHPEKIKEVYKKWYSKTENKKKHKLRVDKFNAKNPEVTKMSYKKWRKNNMNYLRKYDNNKYKTDINYRLKKIISANINQNLNNKINTTIEYLGISIKEYNQYLEFKFKQPMSWSNYGIVWEIDHIIPISIFDLTIEENIYKAFNYNNTEPKFITTEIAESFGYKNEIGNRNKLNKVF